jgi:hypothetical protein
MTHLSDRWSLSVSPFFPFPCSFPFSFLLRCHRWQVLLPRACGYLTRDLLPYSSFPSISPISLSVWAPSPLYLPWPRGSNQINSGWFLSFLSPLSVFKYRQEPHYRSHPPAPALVRLAHVSLSLLCHHHRGCASPKLPRSSRGHGRDLWSSHCFSDLLRACFYHRSAPSRHPGFTGVSLFAIHHRLSFSPLLPSRWELYRSHLSPSFTPSLSQVALATRSAVPASSDEESSCALQHTVLSPTSPLPAPGVLRVRLTMGYKFCTIRFKDRSGLESGSIYSHFWAIIYLGPWHFVKNYLDHNPLPALPAREAEPSPLVHRIPIARPIMLKPESNLGPQILIGRPPLVGTHASEPSSCICENPLH